MTRTVEGAEEPCPKRIYNAQWDPRTVKCGDTADMLAATTNIPAGTRATFLVKRISDNGTIETINSTTQASIVTGEWESQKPSNTWNGAEVKFTVTASGKRANSQYDQLSFYKYSNIARVDYNQYMQDTRQKYGWYRRVKVELNDRVLIIHVPIKIKKFAGNRPKRDKNEQYGAYRTRCGNEPLAGDGNLTAGEKTALKNAIERHFTQKMVLHRSGCGRNEEGCNCPIARKCCKIEIQVQVHFYNWNDAAAPGTDVNYWNGSGRANAGNWFSRDFPREKEVFAHEVGHLIGFYDEYRPDGAWGPSPWQHSNRGALMNSGTRLETYYFNEYATWLGDGSRTGETWSVIRYS